MIDLKQATSMGVGAMIGGGIFAVLGVAIGIAHQAVIISYLIAGIIAFGSSYSYSKLTLHIAEEGGSFTFLERFIDDDRPAAFVGWTLIFGYIGSISMYAYTFGAFSAEFLAEILPINLSVIRTIITIAVLLVFLFVNLRGVDTSTSSEFWLVLFKVIILLIVSAIGIIAIMFGQVNQHKPFALFANTSYLSAITVISTIFVSFQGFQLLSYEYDELEDKDNTVRKGMMYSVVISTAIYLIVAFVTSTILPAKIIQNKGETMLAYVLFQVFSSPVLQQISFIAIIIAALFSTASAINATLFGTAKLAAKIAEERDLPEIFSFKDQGSSVPVRSLIIIVVLCIIFATIGNLRVITGFASLSFLIIFMVVSWILFKTDIEANPWLVRLSLFGTAGVILLYLGNLLINKPLDLLFTVSVYAILAILVYIFFEERNKKENNQNSNAN